LAICTLPFSLNFGDFLHSNPLQIGDFADFQILFIYNLNFGDFNFGDVLLGPKNRQNRGITVVRNELLSLHPNQGQINELGTILLIMDYWIL
jgi:hypothetical protein